MVGSGFRCEEMPRGHGGVRRGIPALWPVDMTCIHQVKGVK